MTYKPPEYRAASFTCPHCESIAAQNWTAPSHPTGNANHRGLVLSTCQASGCNGFTVWVGTFNGRNNPSGDIQLVYPPVRQGPEPNADLWDDIQKDYNEARTVLPYSPRAAAALLRLALQRLMEQLEQPGKNINTDIAALVADGLRRDVQQAADVLRVTGNDAVHPGQIDTDNPATVEGLFELLNIIAEDRITQPARVQSLYEALPESKRDQIEQRDAKAGANGSGPS